jgi:hypothetical protein
VVSVANIALLSGCLSTLQVNVPVALLSAQGDPLETLKEVGRSQHLCVLCRSTTCIPYL